MLPESLSPKAAVLAVLALMIVAGIMGALLDGVYDDEIAPQPAPIHSTDR